MLENTRAAELLSWWRRQTQITRKRQGRQKGEWLGAEVTLQGELGRSLRHYIWYMKLQAEQKSVFPAIQNTAMSLAHPRDRKAAWPRVQRTSGKGRRGHGGRRGRTWNRTCQSPVKSGFILHVMGNQWRRLSYMPCSEDSFLKILDGCHMENGNGAAAHTPGASRNRKWNCVYLHMCTFPGRGFTAFVRFSN